MYEDDQYDIAMYESSTETTKAWVLYSERALDTLCLCGLRNRLSHGSLDAQRHYQALDELSVTLHRAVVDGVVEDITQSDLDVLRAVVTDYVFTHGYDKQHVSDPWPEDEELLLTITPERIRSILSLSKRDLPTRQISQALRRLRSLVVKGTYRVRTNHGAVPHSICCSLFTLGIRNSDSGKRVEEYALFFDSDWGRAFMHNVRCGNFVVVRDIPYQDLDSGAKQLFYISMTMTNKELHRSPKNLLQLMNIKEKQNAPRSIKRLESYLAQLAGMRIIQWRHNSRKYVIQRIYNPVEGIMPEVMVSEHEQLPVEAPEQKQDEVWEVQFERALNKLVHRSDYENVQYRIYQDTIEMQEKTEQFKNPEDKDSYKQAILRRNWESFSPYYLWTHLEFRKWFRDKQNQARYNPDYVQYQQVFDRIESDQELQGNVLEWVEAIEDYIARLI